MTPRRGLILLLVLAGVWRLVFFVGPLGSDDLYYSEPAWRLATGQYTFTPNLFALRLGYVVPIAAAYAVFGAGPFTLVLFNAICSVAGVWVTLEIARRFVDERAAWIAAALAAVFPLDVFHATEAHTDLPLAVLTGLSALLFLREKFLAAGLVLGAAHLVKESAFFGFVILACLAGRPRPRQLLALAGFAIIVALECALFAAATRDPFFRFHAIQTIQSGAMQYLYPIEQHSVARRAFVDLPRVLGASPYLGFFPLLALAGAVIRRDRVFRPLLFWTAAMILLLVFWPLTISPFRPAVALHPRVFLVISIPICIFGAALLRSLPRAFWSLPLVAAIACTWFVRHDQRALSEGARVAREHLPADARVVVSDPRTTGLLRLYDGYRDTRDWRSWLDPEPAGSVRVRNAAWEDRLRAWYGYGPPEWFTRPREPAIFEAPGLRID